MLLKYKNYMLPLCHCFLVLGFCSQGQQLFKMAPPGSAITRYSRQHSGGSRRRDYPFVEGDRKIRRNKYFRKDDDQLHLGHIEFWALALYSGETFMSEAVYGHLRASFIL